MIQDRKVFPQLELWGGHECTVNRIHEAWFDQTVRSGHEERPDDLKLFADLGISSLRYPALWERIAPRHAEGPDWRWTDERLAEIRRLGMSPILTLCHHGSGPVHTSLLDDGFAPGLARHAAAVARRYPWVRDYTPVNEPLTTARFSCLYGFWYPHERDERAFWLALLNQTDATRLAMRAVRAINPAARLVQTDDLGFCHATEPLRQEAAFQNERRWAGWDLLCGTLVPGHALWDRLVAFGFEDRLRLIAADPCPPDVIGINHYLSSERLLDHRVELYGHRGLADRAIGHCGDIALVDVDAQRNVPHQVMGLGRLVRDAWQRYGLPLAVTECHNGSTRDEQARWFVDVWDEAQALRGEGIDIRAVTAWSLLGSYDWNRMVTRDLGHYEPGVFDIRGGTPRPTMMAGVLAALAAGERPTAPGLEVPGWWRRARGHTSFHVQPGPRALPAPRPIALVAGDAMLTRQAMAACEARGLAYCVVGSGDAAGAWAPWAVLDLRPAEEIDLAVLAAECRALAASGACIRRYRPERAGADPHDLLIIETGPVFDAEGDAAEPVRLLDDLASLALGARRKVSGGPPWEGVYAPCLIDGALDLLLDAASGVARFLVQPDWSLADMARLLAAVAGHEPSAIEEQGSFLRHAAALDTVSYLPPLETVLERFVHDRRRHRADLASAHDAELLEAAE